MKTALLTGSYLVGKDPLGSWRHDRLGRYLDWYKPLLSRLGANEIFVSDNASPLECVEGYKRWATFLRYQTHLERLPIPHGYPYAWRHMYTIKILIQLGYEKIICIDSDCFLLTGKLVDYIRRVESGWEAFHLPMHGYPSSELAILCKDAFPIFEKFTAIPFEDQVGQVAEQVTPFTKVSVGFMIDRYGENRMPQTRRMDAYCQAPTDIPLEFHE